MAGNKTRPSERSVKDILAAVAPERRADAETLSALMQRISGEPPVVWGSIIGFGNYHYRYGSGREGDYFPVGFAPRKAAFSIYLMGLYLPKTQAERERLLARLGKHTMTKACLYVKKLTDIDLEVLEEMVEMSIASINSAYPDEK
ncbi:DUF1801 domain-containing protein [Devosia rhodophyticola]|uniref:DUF1801 domain-containing protein n=1 Tax=Devosia rhodophyticola TaxID=3026423 RepID=A0ABY7YWV4_9HYPH|nr:DUF1801 domain-containing protein [Devosia rhodophyticola]WDR05819.1 DUF1801 domain-containing protein [Devosia rhodophyticola]